MEKMTVVTDAVQVEIKIIDVRKVVKPVEVVFSIFGNKGPLRFYQMGHRDREAYATFPYEAQGKTIQLNLNLTFAAHRSVWLKEEVIYKTDEEVFLLDGFFDVFAGVTAEKIYREESVRYNGIVYKLVEHQYRKDAGKAVLSLVLKNERVRPEQVENYKEIAAELGYPILLNEIEQKRQELIKVYAERKIKNEQRFFVKAKRKEYEELSFFKKWTANKSKCFNKDFDLIESEGYQFSDKFVEIEGLGMNEVNELIEEMI